MEAAMDFHALPRRDLQALSKRNGIRANMTNAAMADALLALPSVDGMEEIGTELMTPAKSAAKSAVGAVAEEGKREQLGSPLPRVRRVSVKSPEVTGLDLEGDGEDDEKQRFIKEVVRTPGVMLRSSRRAPVVPVTPLPAAQSSARSTRRRAATKSEAEGEDAGVQALPPTPATRRSQRTAAATARKAAAAQIEEEKGSEATARRRQFLRRPAASTATRRTTRSSAAKMMSLDQEEETVTVEEKEGTVLDAAFGFAQICHEKCDDPMEFEEKVDTKNLDDFVGAQEEKESSIAEETQQEEGAILGPDDGQVIDASMEVIVELELPVTEESKNELEQEQEQLSVEQCASLPCFQDSPILGLVSEAKRVVGDGFVVGDEGFGEWAPATEMPGETDVNEEGKEDKEIAGEIDHAIEEKEYREAKEVATGEVQQAVAATDEICEEDDFTTDLPTEFDTAGDFSFLEIGFEAAAEEEIISPVLEEMAGETDHVNEETDLPTEFDTAGDFSFLEAGIAAAAEEEIISPVLEEMAGETDHVNEETDLPTEFEAAGDFSFLETEVPAAAEEEIISPVLEEMAGETDHVNEEKNEDEEIDHDNEDEMDDEEAKELVNEVATPPAEEIISPMLEETASEIDPVNEDENKDKEISVEIDLHDNEDEKDDKEAKEVFFGEVATVPQDEIISPVVEEAHVPIASPAKISPFFSDMLDTVVKSLLTASFSTDGPASVKTIIAAEPLSKEPSSMNVGTINGDNKHASLCTCKDTEEKSSTDLQTMEAKDEDVKVKTENQKPLDLHTLSRRKLERMYKEKLIDLNQGEEKKRLALAELDDNMC